MKNLLVLVLFVGLGIFFCLVDRNIIQRGDMSIVIIRILGGVLLAWGVATFLALWRDWRISRRSRDKKGGA
jgi:amino acid permease